VSFARELIFCREIAQKLENQKTYIWLMNRFRVLTNYSEISSACAIFRILNNSDCEE
jgi:hypothetical protein